jgi:outer membrane biosynthesis protein TonB
MKQTLAAAIALILISSPAWASWQQDWEIDQAAGIANRTWRIPSSGFRSRGHNSPLMRSGLPPYDQQPEGAQDVPEPVVEEVAPPPPAPPPASPPRPAVLETTTPTTHPPTTIPREPQPRKRRTHNENQSTY